MKPYYSEPGIEIYHGDCRDLMPALGKVDLVLTDPPYGIGAVLGMGGGKRGNGGMWKGEKIAGDQSVSVRDEILKYIRPLPFAVFASPRAPAPPEYDEILVWNKGEHVGAGDLKFPWKPNFEFIYIGGKSVWASTRRDSGVLKFNAVAGCVGNRNSGHRWHPFEKPLDLLVYILQRSTAETILDPFMGSGTTLRAAKDLGRQAIGIEIEEKYCEIAVKRLRQEVLSI